MHQSKKECKSWMEKREHPSLETYQFYLRKKICKSGSLALLAMGKDRWIVVETAFSCIKRIFGEYVYSVILKNMIQQEMMLKKASLYNKMISI